MGAGLDHELEQGAHHRRQHRRIGGDSGGGVGRAARKPRVTRCGLAARAFFLLGFPRASARRTAACNYQESPASSPTSSPPTSQFKAMIADLSPARRGHVHRRCDATQTRGRETFLPHETAAPGSSPSLLSLSLDIPLLLPFLPLPLPLPSLPHPHPVPHPHDTDSFHYVKQLFATWYVWD